MTNCINKYIILKTKTQSANEHSFFCECWEPFQLCSHCILCWIPLYSGNDPLWHRPCCYGSVDSDTLPNPKRTQHIFNEIALGGRSVVNLWSVVLNGFQLFLSLRANKKERFVWKSVQDMTVDVCACSQERQITSAGPEWFMPVSAGIVLVQGGLCLLVLV